MAHQEDPNETARLAGKSLDPGLPVTVDDDG